jgi:hypothetical protein
MLLHYFIYIAVVKQWRVIRRQEPGNNNSLEFHDKDFIGRYIKNY